MGKRGKKWQFMDIVAELLREEGQKKRLYDLRARYRKHFLC